jgi:hypothetical protein
LLLAAFGVKKLRQNIKLFAAVSAVLNVAVILAIISVAAFAPRQSVQLEEQQFQIEETLE